MFLARINANVAARYGVELRWLAARIAKGRERAGLHYPSDSLCGFLLANVIDASVQGAVAVPTLNSALVNAAAEWPN